MSPRVGVISGLIAIGAHVPPSRNRRQICVLLEINERRGALATVFAELYGTALSYSPKMPSVSRHPLAIRDVRSR